MTIPIIDERIKHVTPFYLRKVNGQILRGLRQMLVVDDSNESIAVIIPYEMYMDLQRELEDGRKAIARLAGSWHQEVAVEVKDGKVVVPAMEIPSTVSPEEAEAIEELHGYQSDAVLDQCVDQARDEAQERREESVSPETKAAISDHFEDIFGDIDPPADATIHLDTGNLPDKTVPVCSHCKQPSEVPLCSNCFVAGHRAGPNCLECGVPQ